MSQIIAVSKVGKNVLTATNPNDFIFHSNYNTLKIIAEGTYQHTLGLDSYFRQTTEISHSQPITPIVLAYAKYNGKVHMIGNRLSDRPPADGSTPTYITGVGTNSSVIRFSYVNNTSGRTVIFKYYIFEVPL